MSREPVTSQIAAGVTSGGVAQPRVRRLALPQLQTFSSLRHRDFRYLWLGTVFMTAGMWIQQLSIGWLVYDMTGSKALLGLVSGMRAIPTLFAAPIAGVLTDRMNKRYLMLITQSILLVAVLTLALLIAFDKVAIWHLFVFALVSGLANTFNNPSRQTLVPLLVPKEDLMNAYSLNATAFTSTRILGPAIGGFLIIWFGVAGNFFIQTGALAGVLLMVFAMRDVPNQPKTEQRSVTNEMAEGWQYMRSNSVVMGLMLIGIIPAFLTDPLRSMMPVFAKDVLHQGSGGLGMILAIYGSGAFVASLTLASMTNFQRKGMLMIAALGVSGVFLIFFSQSEWLPLSLVLITVLGASEISYRAMNNTVIQMVVPQDLRGRVYSIYMLNNGLAPIGTMFAGVAADALGAPIVFTIMGVIVLSMASIAWVRLPHMRNLA